MYLGIELGSTRIKSVLIDESFKPAATGSHNWENRFIDGNWTYHMQDVWLGLQSSFADLVQNYGKMPTVTGMGISAMMHGYIPLDKNGSLLTGFRTWRNTSTGEAASALSGLFGFNIPQRWSIAHLYQAILNGEEHVKDIDFMTTLAGYVHYKLTGERVLGVCDASGMFPVDCAKCSYDEKMTDAFDGLAAVKPLGLKLTDILPNVLPAGQQAGILTQAGAKLLDPSGKLKPGIPLCPPEGDAGTGMVATNSVTPSTGNVSAGTSIFAMVVLEKPLTKVYPELDIVTTPDGSPVAMVHCNNGASDLDAWVKMFGEVASLHAGKHVQPSDLYEGLYKSALDGKPDGGGLMACNYLSGEHNTGFEEGRPIFMRLPGGTLTMANFMRTMLMSMIASLKLGMDVLAAEGVRLTQLLGHGGFFKTKGVGQRIMAGALDVPVAVMETAGEGGAWGIALLAAYMDNKNETLPVFLRGKVFAGFLSDYVLPSPDDVLGFEQFMRGYKACLAVERTAVETYHPCP